MAEEKKEDKKEIPVLLLDAKQLTELISELRELLKIAKKEKGKGFRMRFGNELHIIVREPISKTGADIQEEPNESH